MKKLLVLPFLLGCNLYSFEQYYNDSNLNSASAPDMQQMQPGQQTISQYSTEGRQNPPPRPPLPPRNSFSVKSIKDEFKNAEREAVIKHLNDVFDHVISNACESFSFPYTRKKIAKKANVQKLLFLGKLGITYFEKTLQMTKEDLLKEQETSFEEYVKQLVKDITENSKCFPFC